MSTDDPFRHDDAAYVLGALSDTERRAFERHLDTCAECSARVAEVADMPDLMRALTSQDFTDAARAAVELVPPLPDTLLPGLLRAARTERRHRGWLTGAVASLAAAVIVALAIALADSGGGGATPEGTKMTALTSAPIEASVALEQTSWGTRISLTCSYDATYPTSDTYELVVVDKSGDKHPAGSWTLDPARDIQVEGGVAVPRSDIASVEITSSTDQTLLRYTP